MPSMLFLLDQQKWRSTSRKRTKLRERPQMHTEMCLPELNRCLELSGIGDQSREDLVYIIQIVKNLT